MFDKIQCIYIVMHSPKKDVHLLWWPRILSDFIGFNRTDMISIWLEPNRFEFYSVQTKPKSNRFGFNRND